MTGQGLAVPNQTSVLWLVPERWPFTSQRDDVAPGFRTSHEAQEMTEVREESNAQHLMSLVSILRDSYIWPLHYPPLLPIHHPATQRRLTSVPLHIHLPQLACCIRHHNHN